MLCFVLCLYSVHTEGWCFCTLEESDWILYRWHCSLHVHEQIYTLEFKLEILWYKVWKYWSRLSEYFWVHLMASLWMKNYPLIEYKINILDFCCWYGVDGSSVVWHLLRQTWMYSEGNQIRVSSMGTLIYIGYKPKSAALDVIVLNKVSEPRN